MQTPQPFEVLVAARLLLTDPKRWAHKTYARDADGWPVAPSSPRAVCWCVKAACIKVAGEARAAADAAIAVVERVLGGKRVDVWQDKEKRTHQQVLAVLDEAIEFARLGAA